MVDQPMSRPSLQIPEGNPSETSNSSVDSPIHPSSVQKRKFGDLEVDEDEFSDILSQISQDFEDTCPPTQAGHGHTPEPPELAQSSTFSGIFTQIPDVQFVQQACSNQGTPIGDSYDLTNSEETAGQQARPQALSPKMQHKNSTQHDLGNCGVVCPPLAEGENEYEPITLPTRPLKNFGKIPLRYSLGGIPSILCTQKLGTFQGTLGGTDLTRIGPEQNILPPHSELTTGFDTPGRQPNGGCLPQGVRQK